MSLPRHRESSRTSPEPRPVLLALAVLLLSIAAARYAPAAVVDRGWGQAAGQAAASQPANGIPAAIARPAAVNLSVTAQNHPIKEMLAPQAPDPRTQAKIVPGALALRLKKNAASLALGSKDLETAAGGRQAAPAAGSLESILQARGLRAVEKAFQRTNGRSLDVARQAQQANGANAKEMKAAAQASDDTPAIARWYHVQLDPEAGVEDAVATLKAHPDVEVAEPVYEWKLADQIPYPIEGIPDSTTDPNYGNQWHHWAGTGVKSPAAWEYLRLNGVHPGGTHDVVVAVIDTGVDYNHVDLAGNIWTNPDEIAGNNIDDDNNGFVDDVHGCTVVSDGRSHSGDPRDLYGHGTHVAGLIAAQGYNQIGGVGVAFNVQIMPIRAAQYSGTLTTTDIAEAVIYATDNGAEVINMSFGGYQRSQMVEDALEVALNQAVLVAAAGNDSLDAWSCPCYPAALPYVHGVMASDMLGNPTWFTNTGYDVAAPGEGIFSTLPGDDYAVWSGTSMAAPQVAGEAALLRSFFWQRDIYSSRFLMGAIWATSGPIINIYAALTEPPTPGVDVLETWLLDDTGIDAGNDGDGRVDSGETLHIAVEVINRSGQANNVMATLRAHAQGAVIDDPYVEILTPEITFGNIGPFNTADNGFIYDSQGVITGVERPFAFRVAPDCPNDHVIPFEMTVTFVDGWNPENTEPYTRVSRFSYIVQRGKNVPSVIQAGTTVTLTSDEYWMVAGPVLVEADATLLIEPGTQVQWGAVSDDPYNPGPQQGYIIVRGNLQIQGSQLEPVSLFPSYLVTGQTTKITVETSGRCDMVYAKVRNPMLTAINSIDHAYLEWDAFSSKIEAPLITNSVFHKFRGGGSIKAMTFDTCLFDAGWISPSAWSGYLVGDNRRNCVFLQDNENNVFLSMATPGSIRMPTTPPVTAGTIFSNLQVWNGCTYVLFHGWDTTINWDDYTSFHIAEAIANYYGGHVACVRDAEEDAFLRSYIVAAQATLPGKHRSYLLGMTDEERLGTYKWIDGSPVTFTAWKSPVTWPPVGYMVSLCAFDDRGNQYPGWHYFDGYPGHDREFILRIPGEWTLSTMGLPGDGNVLDYVLQNCPSSMRYNAFLSKYWDPNVNHWMRLKAPASAPNYYSLMTDNYWGTTSSTLVDHAIVDYYDNFTSARVYYGTPPVQGFTSTYPFVQSVLIGGVSADTVPQVGAGPTTFTVTFNRDMNTGIEPFVTFGPSPPHTDFSVLPRDESFHTLSTGWLDSRTWRGSAWITPVTGEGYQLMRISGAVAADDPWLVSGDDVGRFRFEVRTMGIQAMTLQANGVEGAVELTWQQNDYDLLAGYNLYKSNAADGTYTRVNDTVIPRGQEHYTDTAVTPAVPAFYKFTVVLTDLSESAFSNVASAAALDTIPPVLTHVPETTASPGLGLHLSATVTDNVRVVAVTAHYRPTGGAGTYTSLSMVNISGNAWTATLPGTAVLPPGLEYYILATDGLSQVFSGTPAVPHSVVVSNQPTLTSVAPDHGPAVGGTIVTLGGTLFQAGASVFFGADLATSITVLSSNQITCTAPPHFPAVVDVKVVNPDGTSATRVSAFRFEATDVTVSLPVASGDHGSMVELAVSAADVVGLRAADLTLSFDPAIVLARSVRVGTLTAGWSLSANTATAGQARLALAGSAVTGSGVLAWITFEVVGPPAAASALSLASVSLNDGAMVVTTANGSFTVTGFFSVAGAVNYYNGGGPVPAVDLSLIGVGSYSVATNAAGQYSMTSIPTGSYTLTPRKTSGAAEITAYDASLVLQAAVGLVSLNSNQVLAADVNRNSKVSAMDAAYILDKAVGLIELPFPGAGAVWEFLPNKRSFSLNGNLTGQNFTAILLGDVSGNWQPPVSPSAPPLKVNQDRSMSAAGGAGLVLPVTQAGRYTIVQLPLVLTVDNAGIYSAEMAVSYPTENLAFESIGRGPAADGMMLAANANTPGTVRIALAGAQPVTGSGRLLTLSLRVLGAPGASAPVTMTTVSLNEGTIACSSEDGAVTVVTVPADLNADGAVDQADLQRLVNCATGPELGPPIAGCESADLDADRDVDQQDFGLLQRCISGPGQPVDLTCR